MGSTTWSRARPSAPGSKESGLLPDARAVNDLGPEPPAAGEASLALSLKFLTLLWMVCGF